MTCCNLPSFVQNCLCTVHSCCIQSRPAYTLALQSNSLIHLTHYTTPHSLHYIHYTQYIHTLHSTHYNTHSTQDRHPAPLSPTDDHLGGTYFLGMAHTALQKPGINFAKHSGRADETQEKAILNEIIPLDGSLDLDIKDYNPNKGNIIQNVVMTDPKRNPRFVQEKVPTHVNAPTLDPNYDYKYNTENNVVNMEKMKGRIDSDGVYEEGVMEEERVDMAGELVVIYFEFVAVSCHILRMCCMFRVYYVDVYFSAETSAVRDLEFIVCLFYCVTVGILDETHLPPCV